MRKAGIDFHQQLLSFAFNHHLRGADKSSAFGAIEISLTDSGIQLSASLKDSSLKSGIDCNSKLEPFIQSQQS
jgi:hypothetical protein